MSYANDNTGMPPKFKICTLAPKDEAKPRIALVASERICCDCSPVRGYMHTLNQSHLARLVDVVQERLNWAHAPVAGSQLVKGTLDLQACDQTVSMLLAACGSAISFHAATLQCLPAPLPAEKVC